jgi:DNA-binding transcriptional LysR family regulator
MNHRQIDAFRAVMITGTATGAAVLLHTTQPVISKQIAELQRRTRVKLFELRKSRPAARSRSDLTQMLPRCAKTA